MSFYVAALRGLDRFENILPMAGAMGYNMLPPAEAIKRNG